MMKQHLLAMMEWHAQLMHKRDTWHDGRFMLDWSDEAMHVLLHQTFAHFDAADSWRALFASITLFRRLANEVAQHMGYRYPQAVDDRLSEYIHHLNTS